MTPNQAWLAVVASKLLDEIKELNHKDIVMAYHKDYCSLTITSEVNYANHSNQNSNYIYVIQNCRLTRQSVPYHKDFVYVEYDITDPNSTNEVVKSVMRIVELHNNLQQLNTAWRDLAQLI